MQEPSSTGVEPVNAGLCVRVPRPPLKAAALFWQAAPQTHVLRMAMCTHHRKTSNFLARLNSILLRVKNTPDKKKFLTPRSYSPH